MSLYECWACIRAGWWMLVLTLTPDRWLRGEGWRRAFGHWVYRRMQAAESAIDGGGRH